MDNIFELFEDAFQKRSLGTLEKKSLFSMHPEIQTGEGFLLLILNGFICS